MEAKPQRLRDDEIISQSEYEGEEEGGKGEGGGRRGGGLRACLVIKLTALSEGRRRRRRKRRRRNRRRRRRRQPLIEVPGCTNQLKPQKG